MFFATFVRSKLASLLRPWLDEDPDVELKLGFRRSIVSAKGLSFSPSALNPLILKSTRLEFQGIKIGELRIQISPWSFPSLILEVRGVDVTLRPRECLDNEQYVLGDFRERRRKKMMAALDPEGVSLHEIVESLVTASSGNWLKTNLVNIILRCCQIEFTDIFIQLQLINGSHACILKVHDFSLKSQFLDRSSLFRGLVGLFLISHEETVLTISSSCLEFGQRKDEHANWITSLMDLSACVRLNCLRPLDYGIQIPHVIVKILPTTIPILLVLLGVLSSGSIKSVRSGQELWKIAAERITPQILTSKFSFYKVVNMVLLWSRYVRAYKVLLSTIGYYDDKSLKENLAMVSSDSKHLSLAKHHWKSVCDLEEELPAEAVACARQIARHGTLPHLYLPNLESATGFLTTSLLKILALLLFCWKVFRFIFLSVVQLPFMGSVSSASQGINAFSVLDVVHSNLVHKNQFSLILGDVHITLSHVNDDNAIICISNGANPPNLKVYSFCFTIRCFCLDFTSDVTTTSFFVALGELKLCLYPLSRNSVMSSDLSGERNRTFKGLKHVGGDVSNLILWGDPALLYHPSEGSAASTSNSIDGGMVYILEDSIGDLQLNWKRISRKYEEMNAIHKEIPFVLLELKSSLLDPYTRDGGYGLSKCSLALGRLNLDLDYSSVLSIALLMKQMQYYYQLSTSLGRGQTPYPVSVLLENPQIRAEDRIEFYTHKMKIAIFRTIPDKMILIGALITGPRICIALQDISFGATEQDLVSPIDEGRYNHCFTLDIENIEFGVWPSSRAFLAHLRGESSLSQAAPEYIWQKDLQKVDIPIPYTNEIFFSQGHLAVNGCLKFSGFTIVVDDIEENRQSRILDPVSITLHYSACRDYLHSLTARENIVTINMSAFVTEAAAIFYMDEIWTFLQIFEGIFSVVLSSCNSFESSGVGCSHDFVRKLMTTTRTNTERNMTRPQTIIETMVIKNMQILVDATLEVEAIYIALNNSRQMVHSRTYMNSYGASSSTTSYLSLSPVDKKSKILKMLDLPEFGVGFFIKRSCVQISGGDHLDILINLSGTQSTILSCQGLLEVCTDAYQIKNLLEHSSECLYQFILCNCILSIHTGSNLAALSSANVGNALEDFDSSKQRISATQMEGSKPHIRDSHQICYFLSARTPEEASGCLLLVDIQLGAISISSYGMKRLAGAQEHKKLEISIYVRKEHHMLNCNIKGGDFFLESSALAMFSHCFQAYLHLISKHPLFLLTDSRESFEEAQLILEQPNMFSSEEDDVRAVPPTSVSDTVIGFNWVYLQNFTVQLSQFSFTLAGKDGSEGEILEIILEVDMRIKCLTSERKVLFDLNQLTVFTRQLHKFIPQKLKDPLVPHFRPSTCVAFPSQARSGESLGEKGGSHPAYHISYILKHMSASIMIEKFIGGSEVGFVLLKSDWVGNGSISRVDITMTLYEIQMISSLVAPLSEMFGSKGSHDMKQSAASRIEEWNAYPDHTIPDGAIVAIKDLHEHMYFAVEAVENKYRVVGVLHYTLVNERALFRVKYHKGWTSHGSRISLISLFAKNNDGEPLRLNFVPGSGFVEISSSDDKRHALWQTFPYKSKRFKFDEDVNSARKAFHLVNQKNNCAIAFVDGLPEFVNKPGNPFKAKVLNEYVLPKHRSLNVPTSSSSVICDSKDQEGSSQGGGEVSGFDSSVPHVNISIDEVSLTIYDEVSDANGKIPLIRGSFKESNVIGQINSFKFRIISTFNFAIQYMDAQKNLWMDIISPVSSIFFFHSRFSFVDMGNIHQGLPAHLFFSMKQVDLSLSEISVDVLLYLVGKLNIAGPYAVRTSVIFPNCCKLENRSGLSLLCCFPDNQDVRLAGQQSASIFLRNVATVDHHQESQNLVSVSLSEQGGFSTSPINVPLSNGCFLAWRTRAVSLQDSRSFPGPFVVVEVSKRTEEGLHLGISPLLRISNESGFSMELCFRRPQETGECAIILLRSGDTIDDHMAAFDALELSGGSKRTLMSLALGNFCLSIRPEITENIGESVSIQWSEDLQGGKALRMSGIFDKLNYRFRKAFGIESVKSSFTSLCCPLLVDGHHFSDLYFLIQTIGRDVPIMQPPNLEDTYGIGRSPVALQVQKEIFIYPTVQVYNLLQSEILVHITEDIGTAEHGNYIGKQATISCGSSAFLYANPAIMFFTVTLTAYGSRCKPVNSVDWVKKLQKQKSEVHYFDSELEFGGGKCFAFLRLSRVEKGFLEVTIFSSYTLQNNTEFPLFFSASNQESLPWIELQTYSSNLSPELGCLLPPKSTASWFLRCSKVHVKRLEEKASVSLLDLDILSGFTEICLEAQDEVGFSRVTKLGVSLQRIQKADVPSQVVCIVPRYIIANESKEPIFIRQCYLQDGFGEIIPIEGKQNIALEIRKKVSKRRDISILDSILKRNRNLNESSQFFIQFRIKDVGFSWSGPVCVASLGRFFLKFKRSPVNVSDKSDSASSKEKISTQSAVIQVVEERSSLVLCFYMPTNVALPYRIENCLRGLSVMYYQKDSVASDTLRSGDSVEYVWDDLNLPHRLVVQVVDLHLLREINIDKICPWKPLFKMRQQKGMILHLSSAKGLGMEKRAEESHVLEVFKVGYEVYADGATRVLRICEGADSFKEEKVLQPRIGFQIRVSDFVMQLLEKYKQDVNPSELSISSTIVVARLANIALDSLITDQLKYHSLAVQSLNVDEKWQGAPFASMLRKSHTSDSGSNEDIIHLAFILHTTISNVKEVKYSSIILQPIDLKVDEETLMKLVPFWRTSLSTLKTQSQQFYFRHFEIHPIKITASFLPGNSYSSYSSAQEALRSLLHSVIKVPAVNNKVVELNGILLTHVFVTFRELLIKCAQHYSWYILRAVYLAKGSPLLPPAFASIFDDTASSSLDVFFDPSDGSVNLPGLTLGMFKFISKCIDSKGFSGTKRYFGDLGKTIRLAGSNALFAAVTEISDSILKGAEANGFNGMVNGFHHGILRLAMEPSLLGAAVLEGGPDRKIKLDRSPGIDELYIEGYLQAMLDVMYKQDYLRVRVIDSQVVLKNLPPNSSVINEIMENVKSFLVSRALLKGDASIASRPLRHLRTESEWRIGPTVLTLCEHLFVSFTIRMLRKHANRVTSGISCKWNSKDEGETSSDETQQKSSRKWAIGKFIFSGIIAYMDGRLCRHIPNPIARRIVSGFLLSYLDNKDGK